MLQEIDDFLQVLLGIIIAGDILKQYFLFILPIQTRLALTKAHRLIILPLSLAHHKHKERYNNQYRHHHHRQIPNRLTSR